MSSSLVQRPLGGFEFGGNVDKYDKKGAFCGVKRAEECESSVLHLRNKRASAAIDSSSWLLVMVKSPLGLIGNSNIIFDFKFSRGVAFFLLTFS